jgi:predicted ATPase
MNLARLRANQGRQREAIELLEAVYNRFTEGFETVDVLAARSLLRELAHQNS